VSRTARVLDLEELRLIAAAKAGDKHAFAKLLRRHQVAVYHAAFLLTGSASQAQTVSLQAFVQAWRELSRQPVTVPFEDWVLSLATKTATAAVPPTRSAGSDPPPAPDLSAAVLAALDDRAHRARWPGFASIAAVVVIAALLVLPALRTTPESHSTGRARAAVPTMLAGAERFPLGQRIPLYRARHAAGFEALMPPTPSGAYLGRDVPGGRLSMFAGRLLITEFRGAVLPYILTLIGPGAHAQLTWVNGRPGVYGSSVHAGAPGDVLTWVQGPLTVRIEGAGTLEQALALARTLS
jgi:hypothetical protein